MPLIGRIFPAPAATKVPEVIFLFWVVKIMTTAGGEAASDYFKTWGNVKGGGAEIGLFGAALLIQFSTRRYRALAYWFLAYAIAIIGCGVSDFLHLDVGIPYAGTTLLWAVILAAIFLLWQRREKTLSIHSITTQQTRALLLVNGVRDVCAGHSAGGLHGHVTQPRLSGLRGSIRSHHPDSGPRLVEVQSQCHRRFLDVVRGHPTTRGILRRLHQQATEHQWDRIRRRTNGARIPDRDPRARCVSRHRAP